MYQKAKDWPEHLTEQLQDLGVAGALKALIPTNVPSMMVDIPVSYNIQQLQGEVMKEVASTGVDYDIAKDVSTLFGAFEGSIDAVSEFASFAGGAATGLLGFIAGAGEEGTTEWTQGAITNIAKIYAANIQAERDGGDPLEYTAEAIFEGGLENFLGGLAGGAGMASAGKVASLSTKVLDSEGEAISTEQGVDEADVQYSADAINALRKKQETERIAENAEKARAARLKRQQEVAEASESPVVFMPVSNNTPIDLTPEEVQHADTITQIGGINERDIDWAIREPDARTAAIDLLAKRDNISLEKAETVTDFESTVRDILDNTEEADAVMAVLRSSANALNVSLADYIDGTGLSIEDRRDVHGVRSKGISKGRTTFTPANGIEHAKTVIEVFASGDVSTVVHELGHHYRRWLSEDNAKAANEWVGANDSYSWTRSQEEKFARSFEQYLQDGKAPTPELKVAFDRFKRWLSSVYQGLVSQRHPVDMSPEIVEVFESILTDQRTDLAAVNTTNSEVNKQVLLQDEPLDRYVARHQAIDEVQAESAKERQENPPTNYAEQDLQEIELYLNELRGMFDRGDTFGERAARAKLKLALKRQRTRGNIRTQNKKAQARIKKILKRNQVKGSQKRPKSKYNAIIQETFNELSIALNNIKTKKKAKEWLSYVNDTDIDVVMDEFPLATFITRYATGILDDTKKGIRILKSIENELKELETTGKMTSPFMQNYLKAKSVIDPSQIIGGTKSLKEVKEAMDFNSADAIADRARRRAQKSKIRQNIKKYSWGLIDLTESSTIASQKVVEFIMGWDDLINTITSYSNVGLGKTELEKSLDFFESQQNRETQIRETQSKIYAMFDKAYNITSSYARNNKFNADLKRDIDVGIGTLNRQELRQWWMYMQDPNLNERLFKQGIDKEVRAKIDAAMTPEDKQFSRALMDWWNSDDLYNANNEVYKEQYGTDMPRIENYVPIRSESLVTKAKAEKQENLHSQLKHDIWSRRQPDSTGRIKIRNTSISARLSVTGDIGLFNGYNAEMAHFRTMTEQVRLANAIVRDKNFKNMVEYEYGKYMYSTIQEHLGRIAANGESMAGNVTGMDRFRSNVVSSVLGAKLSISLKQLFSSVQYWNNIPYGNMLESFKNPKQFKKDMKTVWNSEFIKNRQIDQDLMEFTNGAEYQKYMLNPTVKNWMTANVRYGDKAAIAFGGAAYYRYLRNSGMTKDQALTEVARQSDKTQQSGTQSQRSKFQASGSMAKFLTMYSSGPVQAMRQINNAVRGMLNGRVGYAKGIKTIAIYQMLVPSMYSLAASFLTADDDEFLKDEWEKDLAVANILGPASSVFVFGQVATTMFRKILGLETYRSTDMFSQAVDDIVNVANNIVEGDLDEMSMDDMATALQEVSVLAGKPLPVQSVSRIGQNLYRGDLVEAAFSKKPEE